MSSEISVFKTPKSREEFLEAYDLLMETWPLPYENKWIDTSFGKTHVVVSGPIHGEPLVLLPGVQATNGMWGPMIPALAKKRRVYCIGLIDQVGLSQPKKVLTGTEDSNAWLKETLDGLNLTKVDMGGNSLGSFMVSVFASSYPERVKKMVLTAPAATFSDINIRYIIKVLFASAVSGLSVKKRFLKKTAAGLVDDKNRLFQILLSAMTGSKIISKITPRALTADELCSIKSPALIILGEKDITSGKNAERVVKEISELKQNFQFEIFEGAGHLWTEQHYISAGNKMEQFLDDSV